MPADWAQPAGRRAARPAHGRSAARESKAHSPSEPRSCATSSHARGLRVPHSLLSLRRVVHARRRHRDRDPVLPGASAAREARGGADARGRRRRTRVVHAHPAPRGGPRHRQRLPAAAARGSAARCSARPQKPYPEFYTPKPVQQELRAASRRVVRAEPSRRGLRRNVCGLADAEQRMAAAIRRLAGAARSSNTWTR